jgi:hypothetical protein
MKRRSSLGQIKPLQLKKSSLSMKNFSCPAGEQIHSVRTVSVEVL